MARIWRSPTISPETADRRHTTAVTTIELRTTATTRPTWRYRMLLLAIGSSTPDGSDITASDRDLLLRMDHHLTKCAATEGEDAAEHALMALVEVLTGEDDTPPFLLH